MKAREQGLGARSAPALVAAAALLAGCGAEANDAISSAALGISTGPTSGGLSPVTPGVAGSGGSASGGAGSGGSAGGGTAAPMMSIVAPKHGEPLYPTSTWYD